MPRYKNFYLSAKLLKNDDFLIYQDQLARFITGENAGLKSEKLSGFDNLYAIRINKKDRLLYKKNADSIFVVDFIPHNYHRIKNNWQIDNLEDYIDLKEYFKIDEEVQYDIQEEEIEAIYYAGHILNLTHPQLDFLHKAKFPILLNGAPGSGKTLIARELIVKHITSAQRQENPQVIHYLAPSSALIVNMQESLSDFPSIQKAMQNSLVKLSTYNQLIAEILPNHKIISLEEFKKWLDTNKEEAAFNKKLDLSPQILYEEMTIAATCKNKDEYCNLGERQSSISKGFKVKLGKGKATKEVSLRGQIYNLFVNYKTYLQNQIVQNKEGQNLFDPNLMSLTQEQVDAFKAIVICDETQLLSRSLISNIFKIADQGKVIFMGDSNQRLTSRTDNGSHIAHLVDSAQLKLNKYSWPYSYRCPKQVVNLASKIKEFRVKLFKSRDTTHEYGASAEPEIQARTGQVLLCPQGEHSQLVSDFLKNHNNLNTAIVVMDEDKLDEAKDLYGISSVFTPSQIIGLEFENIILHNCLSDRTGLLLDKVIKGQEANEEIDKFLSKLFVIVSRSSNNLVIAGDNLSRINNICTFFELAPATSEQLDALKANLSKETSEEDLINIVNKLIATEIETNIEIAREQCIKFYRSSDGNAKFKELLAIHKEKIAQQEAQAQKARQEALLASRKKEEQKEREKYFHQLINDLDSNNASNDDKNKFLIDQLCTLIPSLNEEQIAFLKNKEFGKNKNSIIGLAVIMENYEALQFLLMADMPHDKPDKNGLTPFLHSLNLSSPEFASKLWYYGVKIPTYYPNSDKLILTSIIIKISINEYTKAEYAPYITLIKRILNSGIDVNASDSDNIAAIHHLSEIEDEEIAIEILQQLLNYGADIELKDSENRSIYCEAICSGRTKLLEYLLNIKIPDYILNIDYKADLKDAELAPQLKETIVDIIDNCLLQQSMKIEEPPEKVKELYYNMIIDAIEDDNIKRLNRIYEHLIKVDNKSFSTQVFNFYMVNGLSLIEHAICSNKINSFTFLTKIFELDQPQASAKLTHLLNFAIDTGAFKIASLLIEQYKADIFANDSTDKNALTRSEKLNDNSQEFIYLKKLITTKVEEITNISLNQITRNLNQAELNDKNQENRNLIKNSLDDLVKLLPKLPSKHFNLLHKYEFGINKLSLFAVAILYENPQALETFISNKIFNTGQPFREIHHLFNLNNEPLAINMAQIFISHGIDLSQPDENNQTLMFKLLITGKHLFLASYLANNDIKITFKEYELIKSSAASSEDKERILAILDKCIIKKSDVARPLPLEAELKLHMNILKKAIDENDADKLKHYINLAENKFGKSETANKIKNYRINGYNFLAYAAVNNKNEVIDVLREYIEENSIIYQHQHSTALNLAIKANATEAAIKLIKTSDIYICDKNSKNAFGLIGLYKNPKIISALQEKYRQQTALEQEVKVSPYNEEILKQLNKRQIDSLKIDNLPILIYIAKNNLTEKAVDLIISLLANGANPNVVNEENGYTALHYAILNNNKQLTKILINFGANFDIKANDGKTASDIALSKPELADYFTEATINITTLKNAAIECNVELFKKIIQHLTTPILNNIVIVTDDKDLAPDSYDLASYITLKALSNPNYLEILKYLNNSVIDFNQSEYLMYAACHDIKILQIIIQNNSIDVNKPIVSNYPIKDVSILSYPLIVAYNSPSPDKLAIMELLLKNGADPNCIIVGDTMLPDHLLMKQDDQTLELLYKYGASDKLAQGSLVIKNKGKKEIIYPLKYANTFKDLPMTTAAATASSPSYATFSDRKEAFLYGGAKAAAKLLEQDDHTLSPPMTHYHVKKPPYKTKTANSSLSHSESTQIDAPAHKPQGKWLTTILNQKREAQPWTDKARARERSPDGVSK